MTEPIARRGATLAHEAPRRPEPSRVRRLRRSPRRERGATLVVTLVLIAAVTVTAATLLRRTRVSVDGASVTRHRFASTSCADGAREMLLSRFRAFNVDFSELRLDLTVAGKRYSSGHFDDFNIQSVTPLAGSRVLVEDHTMGIANRAVRVGLGGAPYRIVVTCTDTDGGRQTEVDFLVRFGL